MLRSVIAVVVVAGVARADVESGPKAGDAIGALKAFGLVGKVEGKEADFAAERKGEPTVYLFVNAEKFHRPMKRFLQLLDGNVKTI